MFYSGPKQWTNPEFIYLHEGMLNFSPWQFDPCVPVSSGRSMSSLYSDPEWSTNLDRAVSRLSGPGVEMELALAWLDERSKEEHFSLTDVWGVLTSAGIMKQVPGPVLGNITLKSNSLRYKILPLKSVTVLCFLLSQANSETSLWNNGDISTKLMLSTLPSHYTQLVSYACILT